jgi:two-component system phosphate regulon response regulator OmpR
MTRMTRSALIIDDDERLATMVASYLADRGFTLTLAHTVAEGLRRFERGAFELVLLDVMLPDGDGFDVCRTLRSQSSVPIIMLTARGEETDRIVGLELGADDYLSKPFNPRELLARMRAVLRRSDRATDATDSERLIFGGLVIDTAARQVTSEGILKRLTSYQFDLLVALAEKAGRVVSRDALMRAVKNQALEAFDRSIDVHISRIRAAIEADPKHPTRIVTVRGAGYTFVRDAT